MFRRNPFQTLVQGSDLETAAQPSANLKIYSNFLRISTFNYITV